MKKKTKRPGRLVAAAETVRAMTTITAVVVPLAAATTAILGYGVYSIFRKLRKKET